MSRNISISAIVFLFQASMFTEGGLHALGVVDLSIYNWNRNVDLKMSLQDAKTTEPISYATIYLIPRNDTTITNFAISNKKGEVEIKDVISGWYQVNAEMIGYKPYQKAHNLNYRQNDLGIIELEDNPDHSGRYSCVQRRLIPSWRKRNAGRPSEKDAGKRFPASFGS